ncbi:hypothetical protein CLV59_101900 [Chitinophaga dinghuensis]|uniref:Collagen triple helix repeat protein n=1 Tax=Chitinophaga dinghuensis TaxID=1539050 RepID=A0A327WC11_9BACT|nr:hypothetical protein [Chitinophaga dinghuensis]RAJ88133.1 hypothetical protein CLV59_101900 [Chitinophaga dinghuensis]
MFKIIHLICMLGALLILAACSKTGPVGPQGAQGPAGPTGAQGNANVSSGNFTLTNAQYVLDYWSYQPSPGAGTAITAKMATVTLADITTDIFNKGTVLLYIKQPSSFGANPAVWAPVPWQISSFVTGYLINVSYTYDIGKLRVYYMFLPTDHAPTSPIPNISTVTVPSFDFKYVIIGGNPNARAAAPIDYNNYEAVKNYYHLPD